MNSILLLLVLYTIAHGKCTSPSCPSTVTGCASNPGCEVQHAQTAHCSSNPSCGGFTQSSSCNAAAGCSWYAAFGSDCTDNGMCEELKGDACTNAGCTWMESSITSGYCSTIKCYEFGESECKDASNGCEWKPNYCGGPDSCYSISVETDCVKSQTGCELSEWGGCQPAKDLKCVNNSAGTGCDGSSEVGCWWKSGYCTSGYSSCYYTSETLCNADESKLCKWNSSVSDGGYCWSKCYSSIDSISGGCSQGSASYCKSVTRTSYCDSLSVYCQTKVDGSGCTEKSHASCSLKAATAESCVADDDLVDACPSEGDSCSAEALSWGCVDSAFTSRTPFLLVFVAILSLFLF